MASDILHIKDSYYFDVPKSLWKSNNKAAKDFPSWFVRLDDNFLQWEADRTVQGLEKIGIAKEHTEHLKHDWEHWQHESHMNHGWSLPRYLELRLKQIDAKAQKWAGKQSPAPRDATVAYLAENPAEPYAWVHAMKANPSQSKAWEEWKKENASDTTLQEFLKTSGANWSKEKIDAYNGSLHGKVLIPQPFGGQLINAYEPASGFCLSKYMIIEVVVAMICLILFRWLAKNVATGNAPKGKAWNFLEGLLLFVRNQVVVPAMGEEDTDAFLPFLWTVFVFIFGCNLMGMLPWVGSPTAAMGMAAIMALIVFVIGVAVGVREFGVLGYLKNICPSLGLPAFMSIIIVPMLWLIEFASLLIKHIILAMRLVANMVAGHLVLLGVLGLAIGAKAFLMNDTQWGAITVVSVLITTALSVLELFVAFLQAAIFTFLSALFIGSAKHHH